MAIYDNLPYTNFHELNADWLLKQMKEAKAKIDEYQEVLDQFEEDYQALLALASAMTAAGNNVTVAGTLTANGLIGNLTGNVTGNASTATHATTADSATTATNATNATHATTADSATSATNATNATNAINATNATHATSADSATTATTATNATNATNATVLNGNNELGTDPDTMYERGKLKMYYGPGLSSHYPTGCSSEPFLLLSADRGLWRLQIAIFPDYSIDMYFRIYTSNNWGAWYRVDKTQAQS